MRALVVNVPLMSVREHVLAAYLRQLKMESRNVYASPLPFYQ
jgi:hypothetical protein